MADRLTLEEKKRPTETLVYQWWKKYDEKFLRTLQVREHLNECRDFFYGNQYDTNYASNTPKPILNLCKEGAERIAAKITGTKRHISFVSDKDDEDLNSLDNFYKYQLSEMDDDNLIDDAALYSAIDGTSVQITTYDEDTLGTEGLYRGFLKRDNIPFENTFWANPWCNDPQDQRYCGYFLDMEVGAAKELLEEKDDKAREAKLKLIAGESLDDSDSPYNEQKLIDSEKVRVYIAFTRLDGEVYFEVATQYVYLTSHPHALNPRLNERKMRDESDSFRKSQLQSTENDDGKDIASIATDQAKYALFTKAAKIDHKAFAKEKSKFSRYPISVLSLFPTRGCLLGQSFVSMIVPNQKIINYLTLLHTIIIQNFAMPKVIVKPNALGNQEYDNSPSQIITDYSSIQDRGNTGWGIEILKAGDAINSNLIATRDSLITLTRQIFGFDNLDSNNFSSDTSGYAYSQMVKQMNLVLEIPQKRLWRFVKDNAKTDLMYFKHFVDEAKYFRIREPSEIALNENYRSMAQPMVDAGKVEGIPQGTILPKTNRIEVSTIGEGFFDNDFNVMIEVEQGIAGSELTESQHYNQIMGYVAQGNIQADVLKAMVENDPSFSRKTRQKLANSLENLESGQLAMKDQQIAQLNQAIQQLQAYMQVSNRVVTSLQKKQQATEQAAIDQNKVAMEMIRNSQQTNMGAMTESEVKSNNAKGISGGSFKGSES